MGINVINNMEEKVFKDRVRYFISKIGSENPLKPIVCIDMFYFSLDYENNKKADIYRKIVRQTVKEINLPNVSYINGKTLLKNMNYVSADLIHPTIKGMDEISVNLTRKLKRIL